MSFERRFKSDQILVKHFDEFINFLFPNNMPCDLVNPKASRSQFVQLFAGVDYTKMDDFTKSLKQKKKRDQRKHAQDTFIKEHGLTRYPHSSYNIFLQDEDKRAEYEKNNPNLEPGDIRSLMAKDWGKMTTKQKKPWTTKYDYLRNDFLESVRKIDPAKVGLFDKSLAPKAPPKPYALFMKEQMKFLRGDDYKLTTQDAMKLTDEWSKMTASQKKDFMADKKTTGLTAQDVMKLAGPKWSDMTADEKKPYYDKAGCELPDKLKSTLTKKTTTKKTTKTTTKTTGTTKKATTKKTSTTEEDTPKKTTTKKATTKTTTKKTTKKPTPKEEPEEEEQVEEEEEQVEDEEDQVEEEEDQVEEEEEEEEEGDAEEDEEELDEEELLRQVEELSDEDEGEEFEEEEEQ